MNSFKNLIKSILNEVREEVTEAYKQVRLLFENTNFERKHYYFFSFVIFTLLFHTIFVSPPKYFPTHALATVKSGENLSEIADSLKEQNFIRSSPLFKNLTILGGGEKEIVAGDYFFSKSENLFKIISRVKEGQFGLVFVRITIPEGITVSQVADILEQELPSFEKRSFISSAKDHEGYLFPDTYFFMPNVKEDSIPIVMRESFARQIKQFQSEIKESGKTQKEIIIMASILEGEARRMKTRRIIAGILWQRLEIGMPLQVDATFRYINGKGTFELTREDLEDNNPYNTYRNKGLPPTPISSPGIDAIFATLNPIETNYLYFLSDNSGRMYYAETFEGHKRNRVLYLGK